MTALEPFLKIIQFLVDENQIFPSRFLHRFSDLSPTDLKTLMDTWPGLSSSRKLTLLEDLENLSDSDTLVNFEDLARSILSDQEPGVRIRAINLLWECTDPKLVPVYLSMLGTDSDVNVRATAASVLGQYIYLGELDQIPPELLHEIEHNLLESISDTSPGLLQRRAIEALGASSRNEIPPLIEKAYHKNSLDWKVSALHAMGRSSDEGWEKYILAHIFDQEEEIRTEAVNAAGKLELNSARIPLLDLLEDEEDIEIRREIIWSLSCIGGEGVKSKLEELLEMEDEDEMDFLEEAFENLLFSEDLDQFTLLELEPDRLDDE